MEKKKAPGEEFVISGPELPNGNKLCLIHHSDHTTEIGEMQKIKEGQVLSDESVLLTQRENSNIYDMETTVGELKKGPSKVNSKNYKEGYDRIFGQRATIGQA